MCIVYKVLFYYAGVSVYLFVGIVSQRKTAVMLPKLKCDGHNIQPLFLLILFPRVFFTYYVYNSYINMLFFNFYYNLWHKLYDVA